MEFTNIFSDAVIRDNPKFWAIDANQRGIERIKSDRCAWGPYIEMLFGEGFHSITAREIPFFYNLNIKSFYWNHTKPLIQRFWVSFDNKLIDSNIENWAITRGIEFAVNWKSKGISRIDNWEGLVISDNWMLR